MAIFQGAVFKVVMEFVELADGCFRCTKPDSYQLKGLGCNIV